MSRRPSDGSSRTREPDARRATLRERLVRFPLWAAAAAIVLLCSVGIVRRVMVPHPLNPWEAGETVEAWRAARGLPVYEDAERGHATHMYGALAPYALGAIFRGVGAPSNRIPRVVTLLCSLVLIGLLVGAARSAAALSTPMSAFAAALFFGLDQHAEHYFSQNRPDIAALAICALGTVAMYRGQTSQRLAPYVAGIACLTVGFFVKQSAAVLALVPAIPLLLDARMPVRRRIAWAALPVLAVAAVVVGLRVGAPTVFRYMIAVPGEYAIDRSKVVTETIALLASLPVVFVLLLQRIVQREEMGASRAAFIWVASAVAVTLPTCALMVAKRGGAANSWLPALFAMTFLAVLCLPALDAALSDRRRPWLERAGVSSLVAAVALLSYDDLYVNLGYLPVRREYREVMEAVRRLPAGTVVSPEDPTITLFARGTLERNLYLELDSAPRDGDWPAELPPYLVRDIARARYVVDVEDWTHDKLRDEHLTRLGFHRARTIGRYSIWRRGPD